MAAPNGSGCYSGLADGLLFINRGVTPSMPVMPNGNSNPLNLNCYIPRIGQLAEEFNRDVDNARSAGGLGDLRRARFQQRRLDRISPWISQK